MTGYFILDTDGNKISQARFEGGMSDALICKSDGSEPAPLSSSRIAAWIKGAIEKAGQENIKGVHQEDVAMIQHPEAHEMPPAVRQHLAREFTSGTFIVPFALEEGEAGAGTISTGNLASFIPGVKLDCPEPRR